MNLSEVLFLCHIAEEWRIEWKAPNEYEIVIRVHDRDEDDLIETVIILQADKEHADAVKDGMRQLEEEISDAEAHE